MERKPLFQQSCSAATLLLLKHSLVSDRVSAREREHSALPIHAMAHAHQALADAGGRGLRDRWVW